MILDWGCLIGFLMSVLCRLFALCCKAEAGGMVKI
nr:MAG TPA: hypothetical protein [Caudoviricetes sp.]